MAKADPKTQLERRILRNFKLPQWLWMDMQTCATMEPGIQSVTAYVEMTMAADTQRRLKKAGKKSSRETQ